MTGALYYGDNLQVLRDEIGSETVDLVYLDPPFNSNASYNLLFRAPPASGRRPRSRPSRTPGTGTTWPSAPSTR